MGPHVCSMLPNPRLDLDPGGGPFVNVWVGCGALLGWGAGRWEEGPHARICPPAAARDRVAGSPRGRAPTQPPTLGAQLVDVSLNVFPHFGVLVSQVGRNPPLSTAKV